MPKGSSLGEFEQLTLLALMRLGKGAYGVAVRREIEERTERNVSLGTVYSTLSRMEDKGFISSRQGDPTPERGGRAKRYYQIEASGSLALSRSLAALDKMRIYGAAMPSSALGEV